MTRPAVETAWKSNGDDHDTPTSVSDRLLEKHSAQDSLAEETLVDNPLVEETLFEETSEETLVEVSPAEETLAEEVLADDSLAEVSLAGEPLPEDSQVTDFVVDESLVEDFLLADSAAENSLAELSVVENSVVEEPLVAESLVEEPLVEESLVEESLGKGSLGKGSLIEEPLITEPLVEEPSAEEPLAEAASAEAVEDGQGATISDRVQALRLEKSKLRARRPRRGRWPWVLLFVVSASAGGYYYLQTVPNLFGETQVPAVTATRERPLDVVLDANGYIVVHTLVKVSPRAPGTIVELNIEEGQTVKKDEVIARLEDGRYLAELDQAKAALASATAQLEELKAARPEDVSKAKAVLLEAEVEEQHMARDAERANRLKESISPSEFDRVTSGYARAKAATEEARQALRLVELGPREERRVAAQAEVERAKAAVTKAQFFFDGTRIVSPINGTVLQRSMELGETLHPDLLANSLCTIADLDSLVAEIDIQERDLSEIHLGQPCLITTDAYPNHEYQGQIDWFAPVYNRQRGVRRAKVKILHADELLAPDMNCRVKILRTAPVENAPNVIQLPKEAIVEEGEEKAAFVVDGESVARRRTIQTGKTRGTKVEIRDGIAEGDVVLLSGAQPLIDGQKVRPRIETEKKRAK